MRKKKVKCCPWVDLEPGTSETLMANNMLTTSAIGAAHCRCIITPSLCKVDIHFNDVSAGPLVFEIWRPAAGSLATSYSFGQCCLCKNIFASTKKYLPVLTLAKWPCFSHLHWNFKHFITLFYLLARRIGAFRYKKALVLAFLRSWWSCFFFRFLRWGTLAIILALSLSTCEAIQSRQVLTTGQMCSKCSVNVLRRWVSP